MVLIEKAPADIIPKILDFIDKLFSTEAILTIAASAVDDAGAVDNTVFGALTQSGTAVVIPVQAGVDGRQYFIDVRVTTDLGSVYTKQIDLRVRDLPVIR